MVMALLAIVRRLALRRFVELDTDELLLPTGFLQFHMARIPYSDITRAWEVGLPFTAVLCIATDERSFDIPSILLPNTKSYIALRDFIFHRQWKEA